MDVPAHIRLLASYNQWFNGKIYDAAGELAHEKLVEDRHAFFRSILGTLNHILVGDIIWLKRFAGHPAHHRALEPIRARPRPEALDTILHEDLASLAGDRRSVDELIIAWAEEITDDDLLHPLEYRNMKGVPGRKLFGTLVLNLFNHQTHHRGQVTTLLSQEGIDVGVTDLLALIPEEPA